MAILNIRYGGQTVAINGESFNFKPLTYGTARLNVKVNASSTQKFGLTTNTNAKTYCGLQVRVGGQTAFLGRISTLQYTYNSGTPVTPERNGSSSTIKSTALKYTNMNSGSFNSAASKTATIAENNTGITKTTKQQATSTATNITDGTKLNTFSGTSAANPGTGSAESGNYISRTSATANEQLVKEDQLWYTFSQSKYNHYITSSQTITRTFPATGPNKIYTVSTSQIRSIQNIRTYVYAWGTIQANVKNYSSAASTQEGNEKTIGESYISTTRRTISSSASNITKNTTTGDNVTQSSNMNYTGTYSNPKTAATKANNYITVTRKETYTGKKTFSLSVLTVSSTDVITRRYQSVIDAYTIAPQAIQQLHRYIYSTRWSYTADKSQKNTKSTWKIEWASSSKFISVTETCHNMNI